MRNPGTTFAGLMAIFGGLIFCGVGAYQYMNGGDGLRELTEGGGFITVGVGLLKAKDAAKN